jgi:hypothetical protein
VDEVTAVAIELLDSIITTAPPYNRAVEAAKPARGLRLVYALYGFIGFIAWQ